MPPARKPRARRVTPPKAVLTEEARQALRDQGIPESGSEAANYAAPAAESESIYLGSPDSAFPLGGPAATPDPQIGAAIDEALEAGPDKDDKPLVDPERMAKDGDPQTGPPKVSEWQDFFSRVILKVGMEAYTDFAFRRVDESKVSDTDLRRITVRKDERDVIARPFAEYANKNKWMRKHGREVVAATDSIESLVTLGIWMRRVNRIAGRYKETAPKPQRPRNIRLREETANGDNRQDEASSVNGSGRLPDGDFPIYNPGSG